MIGRPFYQQGGKIPLPVIPLGPLSNAASIVSAAGTG